MARFEAESALIIEVPAAEAVVGRHRSELDANAALGIPAHITVLAPFMPTSRLGAPEYAQPKRLLTCTSSRLRKRRQRAHRAG
jgi:hypothetical protein